MTKKYKKDPAGSLKIVETQETEIVVSIELLERQLADLQKQVKETQKDLVELKKL